MEFEHVIEGKNLKKKFRGFELDIERLQVPKGFATALIGENGAGKTTLLNILAGIRLDYRGSCAILEHIPIRIGRSRLLSRRRSATQGRAIIIFRSGRCIRLRISASFCSAIFTGSALSTGAGSLRWGLRAGTGTARSALSPTATG